MEWDATLFGQRLKLARKTRGVTLGTLEERTGVSAGELSRIERGLRPSVGLRSVVAICEALPVRLEWLVLSVGTMFTEDEPSGTKLNSKDVTLESGHHNHRNPPHRRHK